MAYCPSCGTARSATDEVGARSPEVDRDPDVATAPTANLGRNLRTALAPRVFVGALVGVLVATGALFGAAAVLSTSPYLQDVHPVWLGMLTALAAWGIDVGYGEVEGAAWPSGFLLFAVVLGSCLRLVAFRRAEAVNGLRLAGSITMVLLFMGVLALSMVTIIEVLDPAWADLYGAAAPDASGRSVSVDASRAVVLVPALAVGVVMVASTHRSAPRISVDSWWRAPGLAVTGALRLLLVVLALAALIGPPLVASGREDDRLTGQWVTAPMGDWAIIDWVQHLDGTFVRAAVMQGMSARSPFERGWLGLFAEDTPLVLVPLFVGALGVSVVVGLRIGTQLPPARPRRAPVLLLPVFYAAAWALVVIAFEDSVPVRLDVPTVVGVAFLQGLVCAVSAAFVQPLLMRWPRLAMTMTGAGAHPEVADRLVATRAGRDRKVPHYLLSSSRAGSPAVARRRNAQRAGALAVVAALTGAGLVLTASAPAYARNADVPCVSIFDARETGDIEPPPPEPVGSFADEIDAAEEAMAEATKRADKLLQRLPAGTTDLPGEISEAMADVGSATSSLASANARLRQAQRAYNWADDTGWARRQLEQAQDDYEMFRQWDTDGFWAEQVEDAEKELARAEAALAEERARLDAATAARDASLADLQTAETRLTELNDRLAPYQGIVDEIETLERDALGESVKLVNAQDAWEDEYADRVTAASVDQSHVEGCRAWGTSAVGALGGCAGLLVLGLSTALVTRQRRTRPGETPAPE
jgi:hypothetical protein